MVEREGDTAEQGTEVATDCDGLFDNIDDFLEFPAGDILDVGAGGWGEGCNFLCSGPLMLACSDAGEDDFAGAAGLSVPTEEIPDVKWMSNFMVDDSDSFCDNIFLLDEPAECGDGGKDSQFMTLSPISVLESTSSASSSKDTAATLPFHLESAARRARSKRPRAPRGHIISPATSSFGETDPDASFCAPLVDSSDLFDLDYCVKSRPGKKLVKCKKKKREDVDWDCYDVGDAEMPLRKCAHCGIQKTPQWRAGPDGPKTLCNACGVRYKSGRLFPEYRPAASPTFVPSIHSNSHKKVLEMRHRMGPKGPAPVPIFVRKTFPSGADHARKPSYGNDLIEHMNL